MLTFAVRFSSLVQLEIQLGEDDAGCEIVSNRNYASEEGVAAEISARKVPKSLSPNSSEVKKKTEMCKVAILRANP